jgi:hypothetical protein
VVGESVAYIVSSELAYASEVVGEFVQLPWTLSVQVRRLLPVAEAPSASIIWVPASVFHQ